MWIVGRKAFLFSDDHRLFAMVSFETVAGTIVVFPFRFIEISSNNFHLF